MPRCFETKAHDKSRVTSGVPSAKYTARGESLRDVSWELGTRTYVWDFALIAYTHASANGTRW